MIYPKSKSIGKERRRKKHPPSILQKKDGTCYLCMKLDHNFAIHKGLHEHHVFDGQNKQISEENGFKVYLCWQHHTYGQQAVHNNIDNMRLIQQDIQREYEKTHTREQFMRLIGRNYL